MEAWTPEERQIFYLSLERLVERGKFLDRFYEIFIASSEEVREKFKNTDLEKQKHALKLSFYLLFMASEKDEKGLAELNRIAERHSKVQLDITPHLYWLWRDCLIQAVRECDPEFSESVEAAWVKIANIGIDYLVERYISGPL